MFTSHLCQGLSWVLATALHRGTYMHTRQQRCSPTAALLVLLLLLLLLYCRPSSEQVVPAHGTCAVMCHPPVYAFHVEVMGAGQAPQHLTGSVVTQADCTVRRVLLGSLAAAAAAPPLSGSSSSGAPISASLRGVPLLGNKVMGPLCTEGLEGVRRGGGSPPPGTAAGCRPTSSPKLPATAKLAARAVVSACMSRSAALLSPWPTAGTCG
eukprot:CAMPEP_0202898446 /NCGR_PEP_ID=MMETSP1392-20130828/6971_1 /ASSEMBLY_ACC=CAM_ASM_000868 /TAXON_ID=225041 /ORGANISM="Chlamydomonas chlamydogama, Strain SAG 11-48b" /LENGTH=209 /DNA_ID=CAMNT_0049584379 /DNA_START=283 /DNA_END=913 /DNA_ORIENTATION=-